MKRNCVCLVVALLILAFIPTAVFALPKDAKWEYVLTYKDDVYFADTQNVRVAKNIVTYWTRMNMEKSGVVAIFLITVDGDALKHRIEEYHEYDARTQELLYESYRPTEWQDVLPNTPIDKLTNFILDDQLKK